MSTGFTRRGALGLFGTSAAAVALAGCSSWNGSGTGGAATLEMADYEAYPQVTFMQKLLAAVKPQTGTAVSLDNLPGSSAATYPGNAH